MAGAEAAILLKDVQGEKSIGRIAGLLKSGSKTVCRGELILLLPRVKVVPRKDGKPAHNYQLVSDPSITLYCDDFDLAPLSDYECDIMEAIKSREARYEVFQKDILDWGAKLKKGTPVCVMLPSKYPVSGQRAVSMIKYIGPLPNEQGIQFGVEITEAQFRHQGSSNGFFSGQQYFTCDENCALFVPLDRLSPVEPKPQDQQNQGTCVDTRAHEHARSQAIGDQKTIQQVTQKSEDEYLKDALNISRIDREQQARLLREIARKHHEEKKQSASPGLSEQQVQSSTGASSARDRVHAYDSPYTTRRELQKMRDQRSILDEHLLGHHSGGGGDYRNIPLRHQQSMPGPSAADEHYGNIIGTGGVLQQQQQGVQQQGMQRAQPLQHHSLQQYKAVETQQPYVAAPPETISHSFSMGSTVQLQSNPPRYGVIQWIGMLPGILEGRIAGIELEEPMEGCGDGTWNGVRYFNCQTGHSIFFPLSSLTPDQRFAQTATVYGNPLDYVAYEELRDQVINPGKIREYIGDGMGIQGHQNSCYLDSTVFGLFAASDMFDSIFLEQGQGDPAGDDVKYLLWKGIINPLRKNGVVRYESVMRFRNKLEELGKMKGVNQDEKDPEEFLYMLFKHTLHVPPFLNIKRPFGVEQEYFVQLFVEPDESLKLPTVGNLLEIMFKEQKIRFTKVPSKLLIQIPRYGREFKTYQKTIPGIKLGLKGLVSSKRHCFMCGDSAWKECRECKSFFATNEAVVYFCEKCSQIVHDKCFKHDKHVVKDVVADAGGVNELDLLSVICIETSHYICFTRSEDRWVFFDSMANRVNDMYNIPKVVDCTNVLNEWVYPANGDLTRLLNTPPRELPEYVRRFTQDIYLCVYIQPDFAMYGDFDDKYFSISEVGQERRNLQKSGEDHATLQQELDELKAKNTTLQQQKEEASIQITQLQQECMQLKATHQEELIEKERSEKARHQQDLEQIQSRHQQELQQIQDRHHQELQQVETQRQSVEQRLLFEESRVLELERKFVTANAEAKDVHFTQLLNPQGADSSWNVPRNEVTIREEIGRGASGLVSKGQFRGQTVAVKQIHQFILTQKHVMDEFKREIRIMASVQHPNLVRFIGAVFDESVESLTATPLLLLELLHTNLRHAYEAQHSSLSPSAMLSIFRDMTYGLHYLHEHQEPIIHRDVSAPNVLLEALPGGTWRAKLSDFGSANFLKRSSTLGVGAIVCTAPEMFPRNDPSAPVPRPTVKCDVFSYGIVLVEVITKTMPSLENRHQLFREVERKWRMMHDLITQCTQLRPDDRPTMTVVLNILNRFPVARPR